MSAGLKIFTLDTPRNTAAPLHAYDAAGRERKGRFAVVEKNGERASLTDKAMVALIGGWLGIAIPVGTLLWNASADHREQVDNNAQAIVAAREAKDAATRNAGLIVDLIRQLDAKTQADEARMRTMEDNIVGLDAIVQKLAAKVHVQPYVSCCIAGTHCRYGDVHCNPPNGAQ
jgi:hypothetical protein